MYRSLMNILYYGQSSNNCPYLQVYLSNCKKILCTCCSDYVLYSPMGGNWHSNVLLSPLVTLCFGCLLSLNIVRVCAKSLQSCLTLCDPMGCIASQTPLSMGFSRQECWSGLPCPSPGDLPDSQIKLSFPIFCITGKLFTTEPPVKPLNRINYLNHYMLSQRV